MSTAKPQALTVAQRTIDYVQCTNAALEKAAAVVQAKEATDAKVASLIPNAVQACLANERVAEASREKLANALKDHASCVELITKLAAHRNASELSVGRPVSGDGSVKVASDNTPGRREVGLRESDRKLFAGLGLAVPKT